VFADPLKPFPLILIGKEISPRLANWTCSSIGRDLNKFPADSITIQDPHSHAVTVAGVGIYRMHIGLFHCPV